MHRELRVVVLALCAGLVSSAASAQEQLPGHFLITICRQEAVGNELPGTLSVDGEVIGPTMENNDLRIAEGAYVGELRYHSDKGHVQGPLGLLASEGDFLLEVAGAKSENGTARSNILFHAGTRPKHSKGCILLGAANGSAGAKSAVPDSTLVKLRKRFYKTEFPEMTPNLKVQLFISRCR